MELPISEGFELDANLMGNSLMGAPVNFCFFEDKKIWGCVFHQLITSILPNKTKRTEYPRFQ